MKVLPPMNITSSGRCYTTVSEAYAAAQTANSSLDMARFTEACVK